MRSENADIFARAWFRFGISTKKRRCPRLPPILSVGIDAIEACLKGNIASATLYTHHVIACARAAHEPLERGFAQSTMSNSNRMGRPACDQIEHVQRNDLQHFVVLFFFYLREQHLPTRT